MKCFGDSEIFEEQVCPICGPSGGTDDGNRDQNCGTCGKVLLKDGKKPFWFCSPKKEIPDTNEFKKTFPDVNVNNIKLQGNVYVDTKTGIRYLHWGDMGWKMYESSSKE